MEMLVDPAFLPVIKDPPGSQEEWAEVQGGTQEAKPRTIPSIRTERVLETGPRKGRPKKERRELDRYL